MDRFRQRLRNEPKNSVNYRENNYASINQLRNNVYTAIYDYHASGEDELSLRKGQKVQVLSKDAKISGDEGWWTGKIDANVGIFPSEFVKPLASSNSLLSPERNSCLSVMNIIRFDELELKEIIGIGGFGKIYRGKNLSLFNNPFWFVIQINIHLKLYKKILGLNNPTTIIGSY